MKYTAIKKVWEIKSILIALKDVLRGFFKKISKSIQVKVKIAKNVCLRLKKDISEGIFNLKFIYKKAKSQPKKCNLSFFKITRI